MPSSPAKVRSLSEYGGPSRAIPEQPVAKRSATKAAGAIASNAPKLTKAAKVLGPEAVIASEVVSKAAAAKSKKSRPTSITSAGRKSSLRFGAQHLLIGEFLVCFLVLAMSPLVKDVKASDWMKKSTAVCLVFIILSIVGSAGPKARKAAGGLGSLVTLGLLFDQRQIFGVIVNKFAPSGQAGR